MPGNPRPHTVAPHRLAGLAALLGVTPPDGAVALTVTGVTHASGDVLPGDLSAALPGARRHGAEFVPAAAAAGA
ncbi:UDP-N-acetylmuramoyl-L-alanyl-D-glutamate--2,6-diaminopimelate ligase, partial [Polymorphospora sp. 2-325]